MKLGSAITRGAVRGAARLVRGHGGWNVVPPCRGHAESAARPAQPAATARSAASAGGAAGPERGGGSGALVHTRYQALVESGVLRPDVRQQQLMRVLSLILSGLADGLPAHKAPSPGRDGAGREGEYPGADAARKVKGLYVYGDVGSGKSMAMNLFWEAAKELLPAGAVRRVHFHEFMLKVHADLHKYKLTSERGSPRAIPAVAELTAREARVLCLDEFQVTDIADAAILAQLMDVMWRAGVCVVATSNRAPAALYQDGLNRHVYMPKFEKLLSKYCKVMNLTETETREHMATPVIDYRLGGERVPSLYVIPQAAPPQQGAPPQGTCGTASTAASSAAACPQLLRTWEMLTGPAGAGEERAGGGSPAAAAAGEGGSAGAGRGRVQGGLGTPVAIGFGRQLVAEVTVDRGGVRAVWLTADALFQASLGPVDYLHVARRFDVVLVQDLAPFDLRHHNQARRFMSFIDIMYDEGCLLVLFFPRPPLPVSLSVSRARARCLSLDVNVELWGMP